VTTTLLSTAGPLHDALWACLTDDEQARARRYLVEPPRRAFVHTRAALRRQLAALLALDDARQVRFTHGPHGKPALAPDLFARRPLHFNVSHSHDMAVITIDMRAEVGVDIEYLNTRTDIQMMMPRVFSPSEQAAILALDPSEQRAAFFRVWSRKEAYIKALGTGLALDLRAFDVSCGPDALLLDARHEGAEPAAWRYEPVEAPAGYALALIRRVA
jgi:4'-phosphopantetheinyl transferase